MAIILDSAHHLVWMSDITVITTLLLLLTDHHHCQLLDILHKGEWVKSLFIFHSLCSSWSDSEETWITRNVNWHVMVTGITKFHCVASNHTHAGVISVTAIASRWPLNSFLSDHICIYEFPKNSDVTLLFFLLLC